MTTPDLPADLYGEALEAAERNMLARYPKADLYEPGTGFSWSQFLPALEDSMRVIAAQAAAAERERIRCARARFGADDNGEFSINGRKYYYVPADLLRQDGDTDGNT